MKIILSTINARYSHTSFGLRYLYANLGEYTNSTEIIEFSLQDTHTDIAERLIDENPDVLGLGVYIWNVDMMIKVVEIIKSTHPHIKMVLGGPEVTYEYEKSPMYDLADHIICGEGEKLFYNLVKAIDENKPTPKIHHNQTPLDLSTIKTPYDLYSDEDIENRLIYVEASRGCPFSCEFCISSRSKGVRDFDIDKFLSDMKTLIERGVRTFKFVDRTFNLKKDRIRKLLTMFKENWRDGIILHFEIFPDRLSDEILEMMQGFPPEALHLEAGVQTFTPKVLTAISRKQDEAKTLKVLKYLKEETGADIHADLVAGLPYETYESFKLSFDKLITANPQNIQMGILKRLNGAPIIRHQDDCKMVYSKYNPYEIMQTKDMSYKELQHIKRFARFFDLYYNHENFPKAMELLWKTNDTSKFDAFMAFSKWIWQTTNQTHKISLFRQFKLLFEYLDLQGLDKKEIATELYSDFNLKKGRKGNIDFLLDNL